MLLGGSRQWVIYRHDLYDKNNYNFLWMVQISYIFLRQWDNWVFAILLMWDWLCKVSWCHEAMTKSIQKGWKQLKYWISHSPVRPPLTELHCLYFESPLITTCLTSIILISIGFSCSTIFNIKIARRISSFQIWLQKS